MTSAVHNLALPYLRTWVRFGPPYLIYINIASIEKGQDFAIHFYWIIKITLLGKVIIYKNCFNLNFTLFMPITYNVLTPVQNTSTNLLVALKLTGGCKSDL